jgi:hypothetical protein
MKPLKLQAIKLPQQPIRYPSQWSPGDLRFYSGLPNGMRVPFEHHLARSGWEENSDAATPVLNDITITNGSVYVHTDDDYGVMAITLIDSADETELITRHGGIRMMVGDVVVFDTDYWHAWISHGPCAIAGMCVQRITLPTTDALR